ncbi:NUDIX hydrolase [Patescibacteria group bacterium]|nr:NUDIX hydrolase [Patescibacteria group bacterium]
MLPTKSMGQNDQIFYVGLKAFIADGEKLLIVQDQDGQWELPGGKVQIEEDVAAALSREVREEIGESADIEIGSAFHAWIRQPHPDLKFLLFLVGFRCFWKRGEISISPEHKNFRWITKEEVDSIGFENTYKDAIKYYFQSLEK